MFYNLLFPLHTTYGWMNIFRYQTFRAVLAFFFAFVFVLVLQPVFIRKLQKLGVKGQPIREEGPKDHQVKQGTPTMGGLVVVAAVLLSVLLFTDLTSRLVWLAVVVMCSYAGLGFLDDWRKVTKQNTGGVPGRVKLLWQFGTAFLFGAILYGLDFSTTLTIPFVKGDLINLGLLFIPFAMLVVVGTSNAVNLTDGLDGLAIGPVMTVSIAYGIFAYVGGHTQFSDYLAVPYIAGAGELAVLLASVVAAGLGFLWYNTFPAQVFMGDIGALSLGGVLGAVAVLVKQEIVLVLAGGIFVLEALSVIIQVYSYRYTGKRVFRMAPIHHHFELKGWAEPKIIVRFWIVSIVLAIISLATLKIR
ncbi:MAG: phospho-N-acetylmuramoyl-pentapeptide-transferase [Bdellovibrionales bacterium]|nr:phospho-N-acetylmuramoyl-pentapeptide-transferase [Bdellovibrionales bacterium]